VSETCAGREPIDGFRSPGEFECVQGWIADRVADGTAARIPVDLAWKDANPLHEEWYRCNETGQVWRLLRPTRHRAGPSSRSGSVDVATPPRPRHGGTRRDRVRRLLRRRRLGGLRSLRALRGGRAGGRVPGLVCRSPGGRRSSRARPRQGRAGARGDRVEGRRADPPHAGGPAETMERLPVERIVGSLDLG
jgi:hypothetical protein